MQPALKTVMCMSKFVIRGVASGLKFDFKSGNGQVIASSEVYTTDAACRKGIASVQKNAPSAGIEDRTEEGFSIRPHPKFELFQDKAGKYRFRLKATNGHIIATSDGYASKSGCLKGIERVKTHSETAQIITAT